MLVPLSRMMWSWESAGEDIDLGAPTPVVRPSKKVPEKKPERRSFSKTLSLNAFVSHSYAVCAPVRAGLSFRHTFTIGAESLVQARFQGFLEALGGVEQEYHGSTTARAGVRKSRRGVVRGSAESLEVVLDAVDTIEKVGLVSQFSLAQAAFHVSKREQRLEAQELLRVSRKKALAVEATKNAVRTAPFAVLGVALKKVLNIFVKRFHTLPDEKELRKVLSDIHVSLQGELRTATSSAFSKVYVSTMRNVSTELGVKLTFNTFDAQALNALTNQQVLYESYAGLTGDLVRKVNEAILKAYQRPAGLTLRSLREELAGAADLADYRAATIARTETSKVQAAARRNSYLQADPEDKGLYVWIGPDDHRTTRTSRNIKRRVGKGVSWKELISVIKNESAKEFPDWVVNEAFPVSHYNSRHTFLRVN
jgi:hypothetical protein